MCNENIFDVAIVFSCNVDLCVHDMQNKFNTHGDMACSLKHWPAKKWILVLAAVTSKASESL
jgi:hypothetical protein